MKKLITIFLLITLLLSTLTACSTTNNISNNDTNITDNVKPILTGEVLVVDNDECKIKLTTLNPEGIFGYEIRAELENKSNDKTYMFSIRRASVNNLKTEPMFASEVLPNKKANETITFIDPNLTNLDFTDIEMMFCVNDTSDIFADPIVTKIVHIYPYGKDNIIPFKYNIVESDKVLMDNEYATIILLGYNPNAMFGYEINLFIKNKYNKDISISLRDASVNGYMIDYLGGEDIPIGKSAFSSPTILISELQNNNIETVEEIEFNLVISDANNIFEPSFIEEQFILKP